MAVWFGHYVTFAVLLPFGEGVGLWSTLTCSSVRTPREWTSSTMRTARRPFGVPAMGLLCELVDGLESPLEFGLDPDSEVVIGLVTVNWNLLLATVFCWYLISWLGPQF